MILLHASRKTDEVSPIAPPPLGDALPGVTPFDLSIIVDVEAKAIDSMGTAFSIDENGNWMTARHVVDGCDRVGLLNGKLRAVKVDEIRVSKSSDTAILRTRWSRDPLPSDLTSDRRYNEMGYFFGFPQGRPGEVAASLLGRHQLITRGRYNTREAVYAWAEVSRTSGLTGTLGGLSGGPVLDADGEVFGVVAAEVPRRGRVFTVAPTSIMDLMPAEYDRANGKSIDINSFGTEADSYRRERRIAQVVCLVD